MYINWN